MKAGNEVDLHLHLLISFPSLFCIRAEGPSLTSLPVLYSPPPWLFFPYWSHLFLRLTLSLHLPDPHAVFFFLPTDSRLPHPPPLHIYMRVLGHTVAFIHVCVFSLHSCPA